MRRKRYRRILGPYAYRGRWRIFLVEPGGARAAEYFGDEAEAGEAAQAARRALGPNQGQAFGDALIAYENALRERGNLSTSVQQTIWRLGRFFAGVQESLPVDQLSPGRCARLYEKLRASQVQADKDHQRPIAASTQLNCLAEARSFGAWLVAEGWARSNPLAKLKGKGRARRGKPQLRIEEARAWTAKAVELAQRGDVGAVAALLTLLLGLRAGEVTQLRVRDLDDDGRLLWVGEERAKTPAGRRQLLVPDQVRGLLQRLAGDRGALEPLFGVHWRDWPRHQVQRICALAGVPLVSAHGQRGLHASLAAEAGASGPLVASALGHESFAVTARHYARRGAIARGAQKRALKRLR